MIKELLHISFKGDQLGFYVSFVCLFCFILISLCTHEFKHLLCYYPIGIILIDQCEPLQFGFIWTVIVLIASLTFSILQFFLSYLAHFLAQSWNQPHLATGILVNLAKTRSTAQMVHKLVNNNKLLFSLLVWSGLLYSNNYCHRS